MGESSYFLAQQHHDVLIASNTVASPIFFNLNGFQDVMIILGHQGEDIPAYLEAVILDIPETGEATGGPPGTGGLSQLRVDESVDPQTYVHFDFSSQENDQTINMWGFTAAIDAQGSLIGKNQVTGSANFDTIFLHGSNTSLFVDIDLIYGNNESNSIFVGSSIPHEMTVMNFNAADPGSTWIRKDPTSIAPVTIKLGSANTLSLEGIDTLLGNDQVNRIALAANSDLTVGYFSGPVVDAGATATTITGTTDGWEKLTLYPFSKQHLFLEHIDQVKGNGYDNKIHLAGGSTTELSHFMSVDASGKPRNTIVGADDGVTLVMSDEGAGQSLYLMNIDKVVGSSMAHHLWLTWGGEVTIEKFSSSAFFGITTIQSAQYAHATVHLGDSDNTVLLRDIQNLVGNSGHANTIYLYPGGTVSISEFSGTDQDGNAWTTIDGEYDGLWFVEPNGPATLVLNGPNTVALSNIDSLVGNGEAGQLIQLAQVASLSATGFRTGNPDAAVIEGQAGQFQTIEMHGGMNSLTLRDIEVARGSGYGAGDHFALGSSGNIRVEGVDRITGDDQLAQAVLVMGNGSTMRVAAIETLIGTGGADRIRIDGPASMQVSGVETIIGDAAGQSLTLAGPSSVTAARIETLVGTSDHDSVHLVAGNSATVSQIDSLAGGASAQFIHLDGGGAITIRQIETLLGVGGDSEVTLAQAQSGGLVNLLGGADRLTLADGGNQISAYNIETITGGADGDHVQLGGAAGQTVSVAGVETIIGSAHADTITVTGGDSLVVGSSGGDTITLQPGGGQDIIAYTSQLEGSGFGVNTGFDLIHHFQSSIDKVSILEGGLLQQAVDKDADGTLALSTRAQGQVDLGMDEVVYLTQTVGGRGLVANGYADFLAALGEVTGSGPTVIVANDDQSSGMFYVNDFGGGTLAAGNVRLLGLFQNAVLQQTDIALP